MGFESIRKFIPDGRVGGRSSIGDKVGFAIDRAGYKGRFAIRITIPEKVAKVCRLIKGDKVDLLFDTENMLGLIKRVNADGNGWTLTTNGANKSGLTLKLTWRPGMPSATKPVVCDYMNNEDGLVFELTSEISFNEAARK